jgi:hypothetical protein
MLQGTVVEVRAQARERPDVDVGIREGRAQALEHLADSPSRRSVANSRCERASPYASAQSSSS